MRAANCAYQGVRHAHAIRPDGDSGTNSFPTWSPLTVLGPPSWNQFPIAAATCVAWVREPKTLVRGNAAGAAMRTFANMPGSITAQRAMPKPSLTSLGKMKWASDIHAGYFPRPTEQRDSIPMD